MMKSCNTVEEHRFGVQKDQSPNISGRFHLVAQGPPKRDQIKAPPRPTLWL